jgi:hypothetical protein
MNALTWKELFLLVLASAGAGALISSTINGVVAFLLKKRELQRQDEHLAIKLTEMKHEQLMAIQELAKIEGRTVPMDFWDPLVSAIGYLRALDEFRRTGRWEKGETSHATSAK